MGRGETENMWESKKKRNILEVGASPKEGGAFFTRVTLLLGSGLIKEFTQDKRCNAPELVLGCE